MVFDATFFVALSFFIFLALAYKPLGRAIAGALDGRAARIEGELSEAIRLREEAQVTLSEYEKKYREIEAESETILNNAKATATQLQDEAARHLQKAVEARLFAANEKIQRAEELAVQDVQRQIVDVALAAAKDVIREKMQDEADDKLIDLAVQDITRVIH